jgi:hypothetical protein
MKFIISIILTGLLAFVIDLYLPWWGIAIAAFLVAALIHQQPRFSYLSGFFGIFLLWFLLSWLIDLKNESILSQKIAVLLPLGGSAFLLMLVTALIGGIVGGLGALSGSFLRRGFALSRQ